MEDVWDWRWMVYVGRVLLGLPKEEFWKSTPREICALLDVYLEAHGEEGHERLVPIDYVM